MKIWRFVLGGLAVLGLIALGLFGLVFYHLHHLEVEQVTDDLHVIYGLGGNVGVLATSEGTVIVDTMTSSYQGNRIRDLAQALTGQEVVMVINTHYHLDHTHGNPAFAEGTRVLSTTRTLQHLLKLDGEYFSEEAMALLPNETFDDASRLEVGNKTLLLLHPGRGHTDGDLVVVMEEDATVHLGDLFFHKHYPNIDLEAGGSVQAWGAALDVVLALPFDRVIPGHGQVTGRSQLKQFQRFIRQLADIGRWAKAEGLSLEETLATDRLTEDAGYEPISFVLPIGLDRAFVLRRTWEETHQAFQRH